jgi:hypothetical protein
MQTGNKARNNRMDASARIIRTPAGDGESPLGQFFPIAVYAFLAFLLMLPLLGPGYYLALDIQFGPSSFSDFQFGELYGTSPSQYGAYLPVKLAMAAVSQILPIEIVEKSLLFGMLFLCGWGMHGSLPKNLGHSRFFAGLSYMLNPFVFVRFLAGHWSLLLSYALWPFAIASFLEFLDKPKDDRALAKAALLTSAAAVSSHGLLMLLIVFAFLFLARAMKASFYDPSSKSVFLLARRTALLALLFLILNLYWLVPTYVLSQGMYAPSAPEASLEQFGSQGFGLPVGFAVLTMHGFWREGYAMTKDVFPFWHAPFILMLALSILGLAWLFRSDRGLSASIFAAGAIGFLLALGAASPVSSIFSIAGGALPLYLVFRDTQKFVGLLCLAYAWSGAFGVDAALSIIGKASGSVKPGTILSLAALALLVSLPIIYDYGFFGFLGQIKPSQYPADWYNAEKIIKADLTPSNILVYPAHLYYTYPFVKSYQKTLGQPASQFFSKPVISASSVETRLVQSDVNDSREEYLRFLFDNRQFINHTAEMLLPLDARYIILLKSDPTSIHYLYLFSRKGGVKDIELVYEGDQLYLFRNNLVKGPFFSSKEDGSGCFDAILANSGKGVYSPDVAYGRTGAMSFDITGPEGGIVSTARYPQAYLLGAGSSDWHGLLTMQDGPAYIVNWVFCATLALFIIAWSLAIWFVSGPWRPSPILPLAISALAGVLIYLSVYSGAIGMASLGTIMLLSFPVAFLAGTVSRRGGRA